MFQKIKERSLHFCILTFFLGLFLGLNVSLIATNAEPAHKYLDYFHQVFQIIQAEYVDEPSTKDVFFGAIKGMIKALDDPFSRFLDESAYSELKEMTTGKFVGIGVEISEKDDEIVVVTPIQGSPAIAAGIISGDVIIRVNDIVLKGKRIAEAVKLIKGIPGSKVKIAIRRPGFEKPIEFNLERTPIKINSVEFSVIKGENIGYIKILNFGSDTAKDVHKAISEFNGKKIDRVILDLRYNPGGLLESSIEIAEFFVKKGSLIVSTKGRGGKQNVREFRSDAEPIYSGRLVVLVNSGSASAAEILSGALRDNKRGVLVGEKTYGKASVQKTYNLEENLAVAITVAKYYTPSGALIHKRGIEPDHKVLFDKISEADMKNLSIIEDKKLMDKFVKSGMEYNEETRKAFADYLSRFQITLSAKTANYMLKQRIYRYKKRDMYDLEFDNQLNEAIRLVAEKKS